MENRNLRKLGGRSWQSALWLTLFIAVCVNAVTLRINSYHVTSRTPDERVYMDASAKSASANLITFTQQSVTGFNTTPGSWIYPTPIRVGYYYLLSGLQKAIPITPEKAGTVVSSASSILGFFILALIGLRFLGPRSTLISLALFSVCPMDLAITARVWEDGLFGTVALLLFYLCMETSMSRNQPIWFCGFLAIGIYFLLIKESAIAIYGFCSFWLILTNWLNKRPYTRCITLTLSCGLAMICAYSLLSGLAGSWSAVLQVIHHAAASLSQNTYVLRYQNGPWYIYPLGFFVLSPLSAALCLAGFVIIPFSLQKRFGNRSDLLNNRELHFVLACASLIIFTTAALTLPPNLKNLRFITPIYGLCYLMAGWALQQLLIWVKLKTTLARYRLLCALLVLGIGLSMLTDYNRFQRVFVQQQLDDLAIVRVIDATLTAGH